MTLQATVGELARPAVVVPGDLTCDRLEELFHGDITSSVVVRDGDRLGLIMREGFGHVMSGPYGFGRALWGNRPVSSVADWQPLRVAADSAVVTAVTALRGRGGDHRHDDVLVDLPGDQIGRVPAAVLLDGLARQFTFRATHDELTGVINRSHFLELLTEACAGGDARSVVLAVVGIDGMKRLNDTYGHLAGDGVLVRAAHHLAASAGPGEVVARVGGDEFIVLSRAARHGDLHTIAADLGRRCHLAITAPDGSGRLGTRLRASVGVAAGNGRTDASTLLSEADMALFRAKRAGGDQVEVIADVDRALSHDVEELDRSILDAIRDGEVQLWYQPIHRLQDRSLTGVEALVRWHHPRLGVLAPGRFLPGAHRAGHLPALDAWVVDRAATDMMRLRDLLGTAAPATISVNLAPATLATEFDTVVAGALQTSGLDAGRLILELPEDADLDALMAAAPRLERLRKEGIGLVLDDMGAGSTSLRHLSTLTIGGLKIDAAFIAGMLHNPRDYTVVKLLTDLGRGLNMPVTAEGVESAAQLAALVELDVDYVQGYHLSRPQPLNQLVDHLRKRRPIAMSDVRAG
ncbi:MAG TPA: EAL domain-containing protein [Micromonosporaceae bacterium]